MGELSKNLKFNNGKLISFELIKENKEQAVEELSENNDGLRELLITCIDNDIKTIASCGDRCLSICFEINDKTRKYLVNLVAILDSLYDNRKKIFDIKIGSFKRMNDLFLFIRILTSVEESVKYFKIISSILNEPIKFNFFEKFDFMEALVCRMSDFARDVSISIDYGKLDIDFNDVSGYDYEYKLYINGIYKQKERILNKILNFTDYYLDDEYADNFGIVDIDSLKLLTYCAYGYNYEENNKKGLVRKIKNIVLNKK